MLNNLLLEGMSKVQTGLFTFLLGLIVTFLGMTILVLCVSLVGKAISSKDKKKKTPVAENAKAEEVTARTSEDGIPEDVKVAIIAAVTAYMSGDGKTKNEFVVRRIKRIK